MEIETLFPIVIVIVLCTVGLIIAAFVTISVLLPFLGIGLWANKNAKKVKTLQAEANNWLTTRGEILTSWVEVSGGEYTTVSPNIVYKYTVDGKDYQSRQVRVGDQLVTSYSSRDSYDLVALYPVGVEVDVYYSPDNPSQAALER